MIHVIATLEAAPGKKETLLAALSKLVPQVQAEEGCLEYVPCVDAATNITRQIPPRENAVYVVEKWADVAALEKHLAAPHMEAFRNDMQDALQSVSLQIVTPAG